MNLKKLTFFLVVALPLIIASCKSVAYFRTPNDMLRQNATVYMHDGSEKNGEISIFFETGYPPKDFINLSANGKEEKLYLKDVNGYKIKDKLYVPRLIDIYGNGINHLLFVQRLTGENSKIQLYELYQLKQGADANGEDPFSYYISVQGLPKFETWNASSKHLVPRFEDKMSKLVADCPALAQKIQQQTKGYFYGLVTLSNRKKADVLKKIIDEYNECK